MPTEEKLFETLLGKITETWLEANGGWTEENTGYLADTFQKSFDYWMSQYSSLKQANAQKEKWDRVGSTICRQCGHRMCKRSIITGVENVDDLPVDWGLDGLWCMPCSMKRKEKESNASAEETNEEINQKATTKEESENQK